MKKQIKKLALNKNTTKTIKTEVKAGAPNVSAGRGQPVSAATYDC